MVRSEISWLLLQIRSHSVHFLSLNILQPAKIAAQRNMTGTRTEPRITFYYKSHESNFCVFWLLRHKPQFSSSTNYPACRMLSRWVSPMREDRATERGAVTVWSAYPQCCLFTLVTSDGVRVPGNEIACVCVNTICFRALQHSLFKVKQMDECWRRYKKFPPSLRSHKDSVCMCSHKGDDIYCWFIPKLQGAAVQLQNTRN